MFLKCIYETVKVFIMNKIDQNSLNTLINSTHDLLPNNWGTVNPKTNVRFIAISL